MALEPRPNSNAGLDFLRSELLPSATPQAPRLSRRQPVPRSRGEQFLRMELLGEAPEPDPITNPFVSGLGSGVFGGIVGTTGGFLQAVGDTTGSPTLRAAGESLLETSEEGLFQFAPRITRLEQIRDLSSVRTGGDFLEWMEDWVDWTAFNSGNAIPSLAGSVAASATGAAVGGPVGALAGAGGFSYILNSGENYLRLQEAGVPDAEAALKSGIPAAALDIITPVRIAGRLGFRVSDAFLRGTGDASAGILRRTARAAGEAALTEAVTEAGQEAIGAATVSHVAGTPFLTPQLAADLLNAAAAGAVGGGTAGGIAGVAGRGRAPADDSGVTLPGIPGDDQSTSTGGAGGFVAPLAGMQLSAENIAELTPVAPIPPIPEGLQPATAPAENLTYPGGTQGQENVVDILDVPEDQHDRILAETWAAVREKLVEGTNDTGLPNPPTSGLGESVIADIDEEIQRILDKPKDERTSGNYLRARQELRELETQHARSILKLRITNAPGALTLDDVLTVSEGSLENISNLNEDILAHTLATIVSDAVSGAILKPIPEAEQVVAARYIRELQNRGLTREEVSSRVQEAGGSDLTEDGDLFREGVESLVNAFGTFGTTPSPDFETGAFTPVSPEALNSIARRNELRNQIARGELNPVTRTAVGTFAGTGISRSAMTNERILTQPSSRTPSLNRSLYLTKGGTIPIEQSTSIKKADKRANVAEFLSNLPGEGVYWAGSTNMSPTAQRQLMRTYKRWIKKYAPGMRLIVSNMDSGVVQSLYPSHKPSEGFMSILEPGVAHIALEDKGVSVQRFGSTAAHEFGHLIVADQLWRMPRSVRNGIEGHWRDWLTDLEKRPVRDVAAEISVLVGNQSMADARSQPGHVTLGEYLQSKEANSQGIHNLRYYSSFPEYYAQQFAKRAFDRQDVPSVVKRFYRSMIQKLKDLYGNLSPLVRPAETFDAWMDMLAEDHNTWRIIEGDVATWDRGTFESDLADAKYVAPMLQAMEGDAPPEFDSQGDGQEEVRADLDKFGFLSKRLLTLLQLAQTNKHILPFQNYMELTRKWAAAKGEYLARADERLHNMRKLPRKQQDAIWRTMFEASFRSDDSKQKMTDQEFAELAAEMGVEGETALAEAFGIRQDFSDLIEAMEQFEIDNAGRVFGAMDQAFVDQLRKEISERYARLKNQEYFPYMRFGKYTVVVRATESFVRNGKTFKKGEVVHFETHEKRRAQLSAQKQLVKEFEGSSVVVGVSKLSDQEYSYLGFSPTLMKSMATELQLKPEQIQTLEALAVRWSPGESFRKRMLRRRGVAGMSMDGARAYANYFLHGANHLARLRYQGDMQKAIADVGHSITLGTSQGQDTVARSQIRDWMAQHNTFIMQPENDWAGIRSFLFTWFLGFNAKSAVVNLTQVPMVTLPWLSKRYGWSAATSAISRGMKDGVAALRNPNVLEPELQAALERAVKEGFIDESMASELASLSEGNTISRLAPQSAAGRRVRDIGYYGAFMFRATEKFNRRATFIAGYRLAKERGANEEAAYRMGRDAVDNTQYEYARWNRPEIMRGKKSVLFVFQQYIQHTLFLTYNDPARVRFLFMLLGFGGLMGLPGADDLLDIFDAAGNQVNKMLGLKGKVSGREWLRKEMRETLHLSADNADLLMHGISRQSFGLAPIAKAVGVPYPELDFSASISMGRTPIVGDVIQAFGPDGDFNASRASGVFGPGINVVTGLLDAWNSDNPEIFKRFERGMPSIIRGMYRSAEAITEGSIRDKRGDKLVNFEPDDPEHWMEMIGQALGATPTRLSRAREMGWAQRESQRYYQGQRLRLMGQYYWAVRWGDADLKQDILTNIRRYNGTVPDRQLAITRKDLAQSSRQRLRNARSRERGVSPERKYRRVYREIRDIYQ